MHFLLALILLYAVLVGNGIKVDESEWTVREILQNGPNAIAQSLKCINASIGLDLESGLAMEVTRFSELFSTEETKEGLSAFVEKRKPDFR